MHMSSAAGGKRPWGRDGFRPKAAGRDWRRERRNPYRSVARSGRWWLERVREPGAAYLRMVSTESAAGQIHSRTVSSNFESPHE